VVSDITAGGADVLFAYGPLGVMVVALGFIAWRLIGRETVRADKAQSQNDLLNESIRNDILPAVVKAAELLAKVSEQLPEVVAALRDRERDRDRERR
jgi:hypothetical protein